MKSHAHTYLRYCSHWPGAPRDLMGPLLLFQLSAQFHAVMVLDDYALDFGVSGGLIAVALTQSSEGSRRLFTLIGCCFGILYAMIHLIE